MPSRLTKVSMSAGGLVATSTAIGPVAKFFRARFIMELFSAEPVSIQLRVEIRLSRGPAHNQNLCHPAPSRGSHTGRENFATGPPASIGVDDALSGASTHTETLPIGS